MPALGRAIGLIPRPILRRAIHTFWQFQEPELRRIDDYVDPARGALDIGTWWGPWTAALAKRCPTVHAFEPQPQLAGQLREWVPAHVTVHEVALSDENGRATLNRPDDRPGTDGLATLRSDGSADAIDVEVRTIDSFDLPDVGFMKIDVEGFELPALHGAASTIERHRPRLMIEIEQRHLDRPIGNVFDWLGTRDYAGHFLRAGEWTGLDGFDVDRDQLLTVDKPKSEKYINAFLFTPAEEHWRP